MRDKIIGLGERSIRKSYYPQLQRQLEEVERSRSYLEEKSAALLNMLVDLEEGRKKLAASEFQLRAIIETTPDCIMLIAADGTLLEVNDAGLKMMECGSSEAVIGHFIYPVIVPEFREAFRSFSESVGQGIQGTFQFEIIGLKGTRRWLEAHAVPLRHPSYTSPIQLAVIRDITERKRAAEALHHERLLFSRIVELSPVGITMVNREGFVTFANRQAEEQLGLTKELLTGLTYNAPEWRITAFDGSPFPDEQLPFRQVLGGRKPVFDVRHAIEWPDGRRVYLSINGAPLQDESGDVESVIFAIEDITGRVVAEQERVTHLRFIESMDRINRAIQGADELELMMSDVLDVILSIFNCDRSFLMYPCDPDSKTWIVPMERYKQEYPGVLAMNLEMAMDRDVAETLRILLAADGPVQFGPGTSYPLPEDVSEQFGFKCFMSMAIHPKIGSPWQFGMHQCSYVRVWTPEDERIFVEIGRRLEDALTSLLSHRNVRESEERYRMVFENSPVSIWEEDFSSVKVFLDRLRKEGVSDIENYFDVHTDVVRRCAELVKIIDVNRASLMLHGATDKDELLAGLGNTFTQQSFLAFRKEMVCLWNGETRMISDSVVKTFYEDIKHVTVCFSVCPGYEDTLARVIVSIVDITDRKKAEESLRESEERFRRLAEHAPDMIYRMALPDGKYEYMSPAAWSILGYSPEEFYRNDSLIERIIHPDWLDFFQEQWNKLLMGEMPPTYEYQCIHKSGEVRWLNQRNILVVDDNGRPVAIEGIVTDITERKRAEVELQKSNDLLRAIIEAAPVAIIGLDLEGKVRSVWNPAAEKMTGWSSGEAMGNFLPTVPVDKEEEFRRFRELIRSGKGLNGIEVRRKKRSGEPIDYSIYAAPLYDSGGSITGNIAVLVDISERIRKDEALKDTSRRLNEAQRLAHIGSWELDLINNKLTWTDEIYRIFEIDPEKFGANYDAFLDAVHPDDRSAVDYAYTNSLNTKTPYAVDHRLLFRDGRIKYVHEQCETYYEGDTPVRSIGTVQDITERKRTEINLLKAETKYRIVADNTYDWEFWMDPDGLFLYSSLSCERITGHTAMDFEKDPELLLNIIHPDDRKLYLIHSHESAVDQEPMENIFRVVRPDGNIRWIEQICQPVYGIDGGYIGIRGSNRDISDRMRVEEELARYRNHLEEVVKERTAALEAANSELEAFAYSVSHDLRAPLRHIDGFMDLLKKKAGAAFDERSRHYMDMISDSANKMGQLIDDLLSFSRMGRQEMSLNQVDLGNVVLDVVRELEPDAAGRNITWNIGDLHSATGDASMLRIVLMNLVSNAVKFTRSREQAVIEIGSHVREKDVIVFVRDNGVGFDPAYADMLFGVFQRLHRADEFEGTGVGLAIARRIILRHGGRIWAKGELDQGAVFYFSLPLSDEGGH